MTQTVLLAHGFWKPQLAFSFPTWRPGGFPEEIRRNGFDCYEAAVPWLGSLEDRSVSLAKQILACAEKSKEKVHIIAHSTGGLDARAAMMLHSPELPTQDAVASITTLGTPHHGTAFADYAARLSTETQVTRMGHIVGVNWLRGLDELRYDFRRAWNLAHLGKELRLYAGVRPPINFNVYAGRQEAEDVYWPMLFPWKILNYAPAALTLTVFPGQPGHNRGKTSHDIQIPYWAGGQNDGFVSVNSAMWYDGPAIACQPPLNFDHLNFTGWYDPLEVDAFGDSGDWFFERFKEMYDAFVSYVLERIKATP